MIARIKPLLNSRHLPKRLQHIFIESFAQGKHFSVVVDVGGGRSPFRRYISYDNYIRIDVEDRIGNGEVVIADANESLPLPSKSADLILCTEVLEHLHTPHRALEEMRRVIKDDGTILLTVPFVWVEHEIPHDYYRYTQYGLRHLLARAGFTNITIQNTNGFWYTWIALCASKMRSPVWVPIVFVLNILGRIVLKTERERTLPLSVHAIVKP